MSLKGRFFSFLTLAIAVAAFTTISFAQETKTEGAPGVKADGKRMKRDGRGKGMHGRGKFGRHGGRLQGLRGVELTDAQKSQIKAIRESHKPDAAVIAELKAIRDARKAGTALTDAQKARVKSIRETRVAKAKNVHEQIQNVLTADQKAAIEKNRGKMKQRREEFRQKREEMRKNRPAKPTVKTTETTKIG